jgi:hypothetical protein
MKSKIVLFVTHKPKQCGVFEFGRNVFNAVSSSQKYQFIKAECDSLNELHQFINKHQPLAIIYNYHPSVLPWICSKMTKGIYKNNIVGLAPVQIGIIHEITQAIADTATGYMNKWILGPSQKKLNCLFDFYIAADPTLLLKNPLVYKTGRLVPEYKNNCSKPSVTTIGSFGFGTPKKGFEKVVKKVQEEFDEAVIRINMPSADFGDVAGANARRIAENCKALINKPGIKLEVSHKYMSDDELLTFLSGNSLNVFMYKDTHGRGLSSAVDNAMAVHRPIALSRCPMFRHLLVAQPSVCVEDNSLKKILENDFAPIEELCKDWNRENLLWDYERILDSIIAKKNHHEKNKKGITKVIKSFYRKFFSLPDESFTWLRNTNEAIKDDLSQGASLSYTPVKLLTEQGFNRILDDEARILYEPAIQKLYEAVPKTMGKKISRANVQQAFVFDSVYRLMKKFDNPKILCVGSYEDTASMTLQKMGYKVDEIDPMINYFLQEFYTKPSTIKNSYQIIFSTSVIEHDPDDESFMKCISGLLVPGGIAILTCDYKDGWKVGEPKPSVDVRFYTKYDLETRLPSYIPDCILIDDPQWDCSDPDFNYLGKYQYTFATFVVQKKIK